MRKLLTPLLLATIAFAMIAADGTANPRQSTRSSAWLGASIQTVDKVLAEAFDLPVTYGVILNSIVFDAPAEEAGLKRDDIIIAFDGKRVGDEQALRELLAEADNGDKVSVTVMRGSDEIDFEITLGEKSNRAFYDSRRSRPRNNFSFRAPKINRFELRDHAYLGVNLTNLSEQLGEYFGVRDGEGALITEVVEDSPADKAGLKAGDVIVEISGDAVDNPRDVQKIIASKNIDEEITLSILRDKRTKKIIAKVGETDEPLFVFEDGSGLGKDFPRLKELKGLGNFKFKFPSNRHDLRFDRDELKEDMKELKRDLQELGKELRELKRSVR